MKQKNKLKRLLIKLIPIFVVAVLFLIPMIMSKIYYYKMCHTPLGEIVTNASINYGAIWKLDYCRTNKEDKVLYVNFQLKDEENSGTLQTISDIYHSIYSGVFSEPSTQFSDYELDLYFYIRGGSNINLTDVTEDLKCINLYCNLHEYDDLSLYINDIPKIFPEVKFLRFGHKTFDDFDYIAGFDSLKSFYSYYEISQEDKEKIWLYYPRCKIEIGDGKRVKMAMLFP